MGVDVRVLPQVPADADVVAVPVFADRLDALPENGFLAAAGFAGGVGEAVALPGVPGEPARILMGLGPSGPVEVDALRRAAATAARATRRYRRVALTVPQAQCPADAAVRAVTEACLLARYRFTRYKSATLKSTVETDGAVRLDLVTPAGDGAGCQRAVAAAQQVAAAVLLARELGNEPGGVLTAPAFAERAAALATEHGLVCEVWDEHRIAAERLGGLLGVNRGSAQPPRLVRLAYEPAGAGQPAGAYEPGGVDELGGAYAPGGPPVGTVALVGKGVTFDSGGLTLKPNQMMVDMKIDMAGAAAVLATLCALPGLGCPHRVVGWLPLTDNMPGGDATRLGDVLRTRCGVTVEVRNADAEGRLILADALALAAEEAPDRIVDIATLTDTVPMAVGRRYAGLAGNDPDWLAHVQAAAARAGELVWPLPLDGVPRSQLDSKIADLVNATGNRYGQSSLAALFLNEFVPESIPWAHLDIAGPAFTDDDDAEWSAGATGFGVRTLVELVTTSSLFVAHAGMRTTPPVR